MKKNAITRRLSLRAKFKSTDMVEVVIMDDLNNMQIELIPIRLKEEPVARKTDEFLKETSEEEEEGGSK